MILEICDNPDVLKVMRIVNIVIIIIKIAVPILLIIKTMLDYTSAMTKNDNDALAKINKIVVKRAIAAILVFTIPTLVKVIAVATESKVSYAQCITNATEEGINKAYVDTSKKYIEKAHDTLSENDYQQASSYVTSKVKDGNDKEELKNELNTLKTYMDIKTEMASLKSKYDSTKYNSVKDKINSLTDESVKKTLQEEFKNIIKVKAGHPGGEKKKSSRLSYVVFSPLNVPEGMPMVLYLHGDGQGNDSGTSVFQAYSAQTFGANTLPYIIIAPNGGMWAETSGRLAELKSIVETVCEEYSCDKNKISVAGHSRGAIGTWHMVNAYPDMFYKAMPVSCGVAFKLDYSNFKHTKVRAFAGGRTNIEKTHTKNMSSIVRNIVLYGGEATFTQYPNADHAGSIASACADKKNLEWLYQ